MARERREGRRISDARKRATTACIASRPSTRASFRSATIREPAEGLPLGVRRRLDSRQRTRDRFRLTRPVL